MNSSHSISVIEVAKNPKTQELEKLCDSIQLTNRVVVEKDLIMTKEINDVSPGSKSDSSFIAKDNERAHTPKDVASSTVITLD